MQKTSLIILLIFLRAFNSLAQGSGEVPFTKGVYGDPEAFIKNGMSYQSLGINAIFVRSVSLTDELFRRAKDAGIRIYVEFPTLNGKDYVGDHPEAWPINENGER